MHLNMSQYPQRRMRRMRLDSFSRNIRCENQLSSKDLIQPFFVLEDPKGLEDIKAMPGIKRHGLESLLQASEACLEAGILAISLFPTIADQLKCTHGKEAFNPEGLVPQLIREVKKRFPELAIITDVALDPYTSHGQDGVINESGYIINDETVDILCKQAVAHAASGVEMVAPSDMMDGRVGAIRLALDQAGFADTKICSYAAKYASHLYGPFRSAVKSLAALGKADKRTYQMDPANSREAMEEISLDVSEGADVIMVKPGAPYLDIVSMAKELFHVPVWSYQVSGEYAMIKLAAQASVFDEASYVLENLLCFKRAGADAIFTYYALDAAQWLKE